MRAAAVLLMTLRGTPTVYCGDELAMTDTPIPPALVQDPWEKRVPGFGLGRDPVRTPMAWDDGPQAGFTQGSPWLPMHDAAKTRNAATRRADAHSMLTLYRAPIALRRREPALHAGTYGLVEARCDVLLYERVSGTRRLAVLINFASAAIYAQLEGPGKLLLSTYGGRVGGAVEQLAKLRPFEGIIVDVSR